MIPNLALVSCSTLLLLGLAGTASYAEVGPTPPEQLAQYEALVPKTILELQPHRRSHSVAVERADGRAGTARLVELNPHINAWLLLTLDWGVQGSTTYHLHNPDPDGQRLHLEPGGVAIADADEGLVRPLWAGAPSPLEQAAASALPCAPLCEQQLYLRNPVVGRRTDLERVADFLRDHVWGGEAIVGFVRDRLFRDAHLETGAAAPAAGPVPETEGAPPPAALGDADRAIAPRHLGIELEGVGAAGAVLGRWYAARGLPDIWLSVIQPQAIAAPILDSHPQLASRLDSVEAGALAYLIAFDLDAFELGFALGSDHPRLGWSPRPPDGVRDERLPGPDGVGSPHPLVTNGMVAPFALERTVATFAGGFKREHGAFRYGDLALRNQGSHYGFIEEGVISASTSSSSRPSPAPTPWSGCGPERRPSCAPPWASGCAMRTSGRAPAPARWSRQTTASIWPAAWRPPMRWRACGAPTTGRTRPTSAGATAPPTRPASVAPPAARARAAMAAAGRAAAPTPTPPAISRTAAAPSTSMTCTATPPST